MRIDTLKQKFGHNHKHFLIKFVLSIFLICLASSILFSHSSEFPSVFESPFPQRTDEVQASHFPQKNQEVQDSPFPQRTEEVQESSFPQRTEEDRESPFPQKTEEVQEFTDFALVPANADQLPQVEKCDLLMGDWVRNPSSPVYSNETCELIEGHQNCMRNGRPDTGYLYWRWNPRDCELPQFDALRFLDMMRHKTWAFIGDSISRNHVQSLLCLLSTVEKAVLVYHDEDYRSKTWHFPSYNLTVAVIWSPFLVKAAIFEDFNGVSTSEVELHLDKLDNTWTDQFQKLDYVIISSGKWFLKSAIYHENNTVLGCHYCPKRNLTELGFNFAYRKSLRSVMDFIVNSNHKGLIFFRTSTPDHFENGEWFSGGTCQRTSPVKEGEMEFNKLNKILRDIELEEFTKAAAKAERNRVNLKLLDVAPLSLLRPDGHPGPYREFHPFSKDKNAKVQNDCLHWCLPGPIDSWNDVIMEMVVNG